MPNGHVMILCGIRAQGQPERPITEKRTDPKVMEGASFGTAYFIEVTPDGEVVWDYLTPYIDGKAGRYREENLALARDIYRCVRYPASYIEGIMAAMATEHT